MAVIRTRKGSWTETRAVREDRAGAYGPAEREAEAVEEIARIEQAILQGRVRILDGFGGLQMALDMKHRAEEADAPTGRPGTQQWQRHLVGVEDLRHSPVQRIVQGLEAQGCVHRVRQPPCEHTPTRPVHHRHEIENPCVTGIY